MLDGSDETEEASKVIELSWADVDNATDRLAVEVLNSQINIDAILGLSRGGLVPAVLLANKLNIDRVYSYGLRSYTGNMIGAIKTYQHIGANLGTEENILIVDDISDKGETLGYVKGQVCTDSHLDYIHKNIYTCTLCIKRSTNFLPTWHCDTYDDDVWVTFPWEAI